MKITHTELLTKLLTHEVLVFREIAKDILNQQKEYIILKALDEHIDSEPGFFLKEQENSLLRVGFKDFDRVIYIRYYHHFEKIRCEFTNTARSIAYCDDIYVRTPKEAITLIEEYYQGMKNPFAQKWIKL